MGSRRFCAAAGRLAACVVSLRVVCARAGTWARVVAMADAEPLGVWIGGSDGCCRVLTLDGSGVEWALAGGLVARAVLRRWCLQHRLRLFGSRAALLDALARGLVVGLVPAWLPGLAVRVDSPAGRLLIAE